MNGEARRRAWALRRTEKEPASLGSGFGNLSVPGTRVGAIISLGLVLTAWLTIPLARPFILGTVGLGAIVGLILRRIHNR